MNTETDSLSAKWILATGIGSLVCSVVGNFLMAGPIIFGTPSNVSFRYVIALVYGAINGVVLGMGQIVSAGRAGLIKPVRWVLSCVLGTTIGFIAIAFYSPARHYEHELITYMAASIASGSIFGFVTGLPQWLLLRKTYHRAHWWIFANVIAGMVAYTIRWFWIISLDDPRDCSFSLVFNVIFSDGFLAFLSGGLFGVITWTFLARILHPPDETPS